MIKWLTPLGAKKPQKQQKIGQNRPKMAPKPAQGEKKVTAAFTHLHSLATFRPPPLRAWVVIREHLFSYFSGFPQDSDPFSNKIEIIPDYNVTFYP